MKAKSFISKILCCLLIMLSFVFSLAACKNVEFKVNFVVDGAIYATVDTNGDEIIKMPENPTKENYTFDGWYWDNGTWQQPFTTNSLLDAPLSSDMSVYAKFVSNEVPPSEAFIIAGLKEIPNVVNVEAATEYNDPNGQFNKANGYIADIFFSLDIINQRMITGTTLVEKGTDAGGSIEVYRTAKDAEARNTYLAAFDGGILTSGSHKVIGTCVVRTSRELTASLQNILENNIEKMLTGSTDAYVSMNSYLFTVAKEVAEKDNLSAYETVTKLIELGYPLDKAKQIVEDCEVDYNNIAKKAVEGYVDYYAMISPLMVAELLADHEFTADNISYAVQNANIDWGFYATRHAEEYVLITESSNEYLTPNGVMVYLCWEKGYIYDWDDYVFDKSEYCQIALENLNVNWNQKALEYIDYIEYEGLLAQKSAYISELTGMDFTQAQAEYAVANCDINWNERALYCVEHYVEDLCVTPPNHSECIAKLKEWGFSDSEANYAVSNYDGLIYPDKLDYVITLNPDGGTISNTTVNVIFGKSYMLPTPTKSGYTFLGWYNGSTKVSNGTWYTANNVTLKAKWEETRYDITYVLDGGSNNSGNPATYTTSQSVTLLAPTKTGYTFIGWKASGSSTAVYSPTIAVGSTGNKTYTAVWQANPYTVYINANGGSCDTTPLTATYDSYLTLPMPTKTGYNFTGWYSGSTKYSSGTWKTANTVTLTAKWEAKTYTLTYNVNGGSLTSTTQTVTYDSSYTLRTPTRTGYTFLGWYNGEEKVENGTWKLTSGLTIKAKWQANTYKVTFAANGGSCDTTSLTATYDSSLTLPMPTRVGYTFSGWYNGSTKYTTGTWKTASAITLTAKWIARTDIPYIVNHYQQNIYDDGYTLYATQNLTGTADATISPSTNSYTGFTAPSKKSVTVKPNGSLVVDYYYTRNSYSITFVTNGGNSISKITQKYRSAVSVPDAVRAGYTFGGWFTNATLTSSYSKPSTMPASSKIVYAYWAEENKPGDFTYSGSSTITVSTYQGTSTTMWIPSYIGGKAVVTIPDSAFKNNTSIVKVVVPDTVTLIGSAAFRGCSALTDIILPFVGNSEDATENYKQVFGHIFGYTTDTGSSISDTYKTSYGYTAQAAYQTTSGTWYSAKYYIPKSIKSVTITKQTDIPENAFRNCDLIESITIPVNTSLIGNYAFYNCEKIVGYNIDTEGYSILPSTLTTIANYTFANNKALSKVLLPTNVQEIQKYAFYKCTSLEKIIAKDGISNLSTIDSYAFYGCSNLESVLHDNVNEIIFPERVTTINDYAFAGNLLIKKIVLPDSLKTIGVGVFKDCSSLEDLTLPFIGASEETAENYKQVFGYIFGYTTDTGSSISDTYKTSYGYTAQAAYQTASGSWYSAKYYIPKSLKIVTITKQNYLPENAFRNCDVLENINLPNNVTSIGDYAFYCNKNLTKIIISSELESIGKYAFYKCSNLKSLINDSTTSQLTIVGAYAFNGCTTLNTFFNGAIDELIIPNDVEIIGTYAFAHNSAFTKVVVPDTTTTINVGAFYGCSAIEDITLPFVGNSENTADNYKQVFGYIFGYTSDSGSSISNAYKTSAYDYTAQAIYADTSGYSRVAKYYIPKSIKSVTITRQTDIPENAFRNCDIIENINIPATTIAIGNYAFYNCEKVYGYNINTEGYSILPKSLTTISQYAFANNKSLAKVIISSNIVEMQSYAFYNCKIISEIIAIEDITKLKTIGSHVFEGSVALTKYFNGEMNELMIPSSVETIGDYAFKNNSCITTAIISDTAVSIGCGIFEGCIAIENITLPFIGNSKDATDNYKQVFGYIFGYTSESGSSISNYIQTSSYDYTAQAIYADTSGYSRVAKYYIPKSIKSVTITQQRIIPKNAFRNCDLIEQIVIPSNTTAIGAYAFYNCEKLTSINIAQGASIGDNAFVNTGMINKTGVVYIGSVLYKYNGTMPNGYTLRVKDGTTAIQDDAFSGCAGLTNVILPEGLNSIGSNTFKNCTSLTEIEIPSSVGTIESSAFYGCSSLKTITIPFIGTNADSNTAFSSIFGTVPTSLTTVTITGDGNVSANAFKNCTKITTIKFTGSVSEIDANAFYGCSALTSVTLTNTVKSIGNYAFYGCGKLMAIDLANMTALNSIGSYAFQNCTSIMSIAVPETVTTIGDYTFSGCTKLTTVSLSSKTTSIGIYAFNGCTSLAMITLNSNVMECIGAYAFQNCSSLTTFYIPNSVGVIGEYAFNGCSVLTINCGASSQPDDWDYNWNPSNCIVTWGK